MKSKKLFLIRGLPGSGKTTLANCFNTQNHFEADMFFYDEFGNYNFDRSKLREAHQWCQEKCREVMLIGEDVVISNTSTTEKELQPYLDMAEKFGYDVISIIVENRHGSKSVHDVPEKTIEKMRKRFSVKL